MKRLFEEYDLNHLLDVVRPFTRSLGINDPAEIEARRSALTVYESYKCRAPDGRPLPPAIVEPDYQALTDVKLTTAEAAQLGLAEQRVSRQQLILITRSEVTGSQCGIARQSLAAYLLQSGPLICDRYNAYISSISTEQNEYERALQAYNTLSKSGAISLENSVKIQRAKNIVRALGQTMQHKLLLTEKEYKDLKEGRLDGETDVEQALRDEKKRRRINDCVERSYAMPGTFPFVAVYNPKRLNAIERIMQIDSTAAWLLKLMHKHDLPIILHHYLISDSAFKERRMVDGGGYIEAAYRNPLTGTPIPKPPSEKSFIRYFDNGASDLELAMVIAHEGRHFWQVLTVPIGLADAVMPLDYVIWMLAREADAHAVQWKVQWSLEKKTGQTRSRLFQGSNFDMHFNNPAYKDLSSAARMKKAVENSFTDFLEKEFSGPNYIPSLIDNIEPSIFRLGSRGVTDTTMVTREAVAVSPILTNDFLMRLSQVGDGVHYLDQEGIRRIRQLFVEKLPLAMAPHIKPGPSQHPLAGFGL